MAKQLGFFAVHHLNSLNSNKPNHHRINPLRSISYLNFKSNPSFFPNIETKRNANLKSQALNVNKHQTPPSASAANCWIDSYVAEKARPYAYLLRFNDNIAPWLVGWPYFLSVALAAEPGVFLDAKMLTRFFLIAFMDRNILLTLNDILDQDIDAKVERTRTRPIAAGSITNLQAICFLGVQILIDYGLYLHLNNLSQKLWILWLALSFVYPLTKRVTHWSQAYFSINMHMGALISWAAVKGSLAMVNVWFPLFISGVFWTLLYETIYSCQDKAEDAMLGLKSTAILFGYSIKIWLAGFGIATISGFALTGFNAKLGWPYYASLVAAALHLAWQIVTVDIEDPTDCEKKQMSNKWVGCILFIGIALAKHVA